MEFNKENIREYMREIEIACEEKNEKTFFIKLVLKILLMIFFIFLILFALFEMNI